jgi:peptide deformylase
MSEILSRTQFGNPILRARAKATPAEFIKTAAFRALIKNMFHTMHRAHGVGLAAPQIGASIQLAVLQIPSRDLRVRGAALGKHVIINPKILWHSKNTLLDWEGCLSFPPARGQVPRWASIRVKYMNEKGERVAEKYDGFAARVFQHEIDHLNGVVYIDRMPNMKTLMTHQEFMQRIIK